MDHRKKEKGKVKEIMKICSPSWSLGMLPAYRRAAFSAYQFRSQYICVKNV